MENHKHPKGNNPVNKKNLLLATALNLVIAIAEAMGGLLSGSLALLSDALHNLGDSISTLIAYIASVYAGKKPTGKRTFGYKRIEILAALINAFSLIAIIIFLFFEAYKRFLEPSEVKTTIMLVVAMIGLLANVYGVLLLRPDSGKNINVRAAYLHLIGDSLSSVVVILGSLLIMFTGIHWIDPLVTILIGLYILKEAFTILRETLGILMQNTPPGLNLHSIKKTLESLPEVRNVHHIHAWNLTDNHCHFECHIDTTLDLKLSELNAVREKIESILNEQFGINHVILQFEYNSKHDPAGINSNI
jgi:cobalt-zinc-cadmium efflux system protein